ncbi:Transmembrane domain-containing protein [Spironucleus salmonicida]|uniref:Transmembrane domain-containing protein n=1 Tax=Spironucleus salmonicida TaxID=348837 RepID=V6LT92_9EUKA|nr:Transmembrane domain-containing protein [Spironucleus salmonicida]|eukprot:EST47867.1 Transmembrane domain-containing protein [Spironucleus salmonicida]
MLQIFLTVCSVHNKNVNPAYLVLSCTRTPASKIYVMPNQVLNSVLITTNAYQDHQLEIIVNYAPQVQKVNATAKEVKTVKPVENYLEPMLAIYTVLNSMRAHFSVIKLQAPQKIFVTLIICQHAVLTMKYAWEALETLISLVTRQLSENNVIVIRNNSQTACFAMLISVIFVFLVIIYTMVNVLQTYVMQQIHVLQISTVILEKNYARYVQHQLIPNAIVVKQKISRPVQILMIVVIRVWMNSYPQMGFVNLNIVVKLHQTPLQINFMIQKPKNAIYVVKSILYAIVELLQIVFHVIAQELARTVFLDTGQMIKIHVQPLFARQISHQVNTVADQMRYKHAHPQTPNAIVAVHIIVKAAMLIIHVVNSVQMEQQ